MLDTARLAAGARLPARLRRQRAAPRDPQRARGTVPEHTVIGTEPALRIEHDAQRVRPLDLAGRESWIVGGHRAGADQHRIEQRPHAMQVHDVLAAGHVAGIAAVGGDEAVEALAHVADHERQLARGRREQRLVELAQRAAAGRAGQRQAAARPREQRRPVAGAGTGAAAVEIARFPEQPPPPARTFA
ncbi:MAG: hypothetical protein U1F11_02670 [Steroidobacteraceae bacterium]